MSGGVWALPVLSLLLHTGVPPEPQFTRTLQAAGTFSAPWVHQVNVVRPDQVDARVSCFQRDDHDIGPTVFVELLHDIGAVLLGHGPYKSACDEASVGKVGFNYVEKLGKR